MFVSLLIGCNCPPFSKLNIGQQPIFVTASVGNYIVQKQEFHNPCWTCRLSRDVENLTEYAFFLFSYPGKHFVNWWCTTLQPCWCIIIVVHSYMQSQQPLEKPVYFFKLRTAHGTATFSRRGRDVNLFLMSARCSKLNAAVDLLYFGPRCIYKCLIFVTVWCYYCEPVEGTLTFHFSVANF